MKRALVALVAIIFLQSCTIPGTLHLYNNTALPVSLSSEHETAEIESYASGTFIVGFGTEVSVRTRDQVRIYDLNNIRPSLYAFKGWGPFTKRILRAQLEPSGEVWLIPEGIKFPAKVRPEQPEGFPILPKHGLTQQ